MARRFNDSQSADSAKKQCILEKKSIFGSLSCVVQPILSSDIVIVETPRLERTWGRAGQIKMMGKPEWGMNVLKGQRKRVITALPYLMILCKSNKSVVLFHFR